MVGELVPILRHCLKTQKYTVQDWQGGLEQLCNGVEEMNRVI